MNTPTKPKDPTSVISRVRTWIGQFEGEKFRSSECVDALGIYPGPVRSALCTLATQGQIIRVGKIRHINKGAETVWAKAGKN